MKKILVLPCLLSTLSMASSAQDSPASDADAGAKISLGAKYVVAPCPVWGIGSYGTDGSPNIMTASWAGVCCSVPPCVGIGLRPATKTYENVMATKAFTINIPSEAFAPHAAYCGIKSGHDTDKFADLKLTPVKSSLVNAPYVKEVPLVLECKLVNTAKVGTHTLFIGEILDIKPDKSVLDKKGKLDMEMLKPILYVPTGTDFFKSGASMGSYRKLAEKGLKGGDQ